MLLIVVLFIIVLLISLFNLFLTMEDLGIKDKLKYLKININIILQSLPYLYKPIIYTPKIKQTEIEELGISQPSELLSRLRTLYPDKSNKEIRDEANLMVQRQIEYRDKENTNIGSRLTKKELEDLMFNTL